MTNFEKYQKELAQIAIASAQFGLVDGVPTRCRIIPCEICDWYENNCFYNVKNWVNQEYTEPKIQPKVKDLKTDDKVLVSDDGVRWEKQYFYRYDSAVNRVGVFANGCTSWSGSSKDTTWWPYAKLPESE